MMLTLTLTVAVGCTCPEAGCLCDTLGHPATRPAARPPPVHAGVTCGGLCRLTTPGQRRLHR